MHAFLGGAVKTLALHNDDATVALGDPARQAAGAGAQTRPGAAARRRRSGAVGERQQFVGAGAATAAARRRRRAARLANGTLDALPHDGGDHDRRAAATQKTKRVEERVRDVLRRMKANESATMASGARWTEAMADACPRLFGMGGVSRGGGGRGGRTRAQAAR